MKLLEGLRILAVSQYGAGPYGTAHLADLGAEVIKIEDPRTGGDISRRVTPYAEGGDSLFFQTFNRNKKSITLNLECPEGRELLRKLAARSDVVFNNCRGDVPGKLGLNYQSLKDTNPLIVCCSLSGFGTSGSRKSEPAYDYLLQAQMGHMSITGEPDGTPQKFGLSIIDFATGILASFAIMAGVYQSKTRGIGCDLDVSMFDLSASLLTYLAAWNLNKGYQPTRHPDSAHPSLVPSQMFPTSDGHVVVMCNKEKFFPILCEAMGLQHLTEDPKFETFSSRLLHRAELVAKLKDVFRTKPSADWITLLSGKVPISPVLSVDDALKQPFMSEREMIAEVDHPAFGLLRMIGCPVKVSDDKPEYHPAPTLGGHNEEIYCGLLGLDRAELELLRQKSVI